MPINPTLLAEPLSLIERLRLCAQLWVEATGGSFARLGRTVLNDSSFFNRIESPQGTTTATLERFARYLGDAANWPEGAVPDEARAFALVTGVATADSGA